MLEVLPFVEDPDLSGSAAPALSQLPPPCLGHHMGHVLLSGASSWASSGACPGHHLGHVWDIIWGTSGAFLIVWGHVWSIILGISGPDIIWGMSGASSEACLGQSKIFASCISDAGFFLYKDIPRQALMCTWKIVSALESSTKILTAKNSDMRNICLTERHFQKVKLAKQILTDNNFQFDHIRFDHLVYYHYWVY